MKEASQLTPETVAEIESIERLTSFQAVREPTLQSEIPGVRVCIPQSRDWSEEADGFENLEIPSSDENETLRKVAWDDLVSPDDLPKLLESGDLEADYNFD